MKTFKDLGKKMYEVGEEGWKVRIETAGELNNLISLRVWKSGNDDKYIVREDFINCVDADDICDGIDSIINEWEEVFEKDELKTICDSCIHDPVCGCGFHGDPGMMDCFYYKKGD